MNRCIAQGVTVILITTAALRAADLGTAFTYQGRLVKSGTPVDDTCTFTFGLWDTATLGNQKGASPQGPGAILVVEGLFTTTLDFGPAGVDGTARWLEITVQCPGDAMATTLTPRQELKPAPHALALPGLYTVQDAFSPSLIGGNYQNAVTSGAQGATIAGGGAAAPDNNRVTDTFGTVGGGCTNRAGDGAGTVNDAQFATVAGGFRNTASGYLSTVSGGDLNRASAFRSTVGGGIGNIADGLESTVGGGNTNRASESRSTVGGGIGNMADGFESTVGGGSTNTASGQSSTVGGGSLNTASAFESTIGGGFHNTASLDFSTVGGGADNIASGNASTVGGGVGSTALGYRSTVGGGEANMASEFYCTVGGGHDNMASGNRSTVSGGGGNSANEYSSTVGGGETNTASEFYSTVGGGNLNTASNSYSTVGGGSDNTASGSRSTVGGGGGNTASSYSSTVPGGESNQSGGDFSFAAGRRARVRTPAEVGGGDLDGDEGTFVWADSTFADFTSTGPNRFLVRASGGTRIYSNSAATVGVDLAAGGNSWSMVSDRNAKENFLTIDPREILERLADIPITLWNLKSQIPDIKHIGPMAQDFHAAFGVGESDTHISSSDADGVALAVIQGLNQVVQEKDCEIQELRSDISDLKALVNALLEKEGGSR